MTVIDLSRDADKTIVVAADKLRERTVPYIAEALIPRDAESVVVEYWRVRDGQAHVRLAGHTAVCVTTEAVQDWRGNAQ